MTQELTINQHTNFTLILADDPAAEAPDHSTEIKLLSPILRITVLIIRKTLGHVVGIPFKLRLNRKQGQP